MYAGAQRYPPLPAALPLPAGSPETTPSNGFLSCSSMTLGIPRVAEILRKAAQTLPRAFRITVREMTSPSFPPHPSLRTRNHRNACEHCLVIEDRRAAKASWDVKSDRASITIGP